MTLDFSTMSERELIAAIAKRPGMFTGFTSYERISQFLGGYDFG